MAERLKADKIHVQKRHSHSFPGITWLKMAASNKLQQVASSPMNSSDSGSPQDSPAFQRKHVYQAGKGTDSFDGPFSLKGSPKLQKWLFGGDWGVHNPKNAQHLLTLLQQPDVEATLGPNEEGNNPLHSIVRQVRPDRDKMDILVVLFTHSSVNINSHGKDGMTALHLAVQANDLLTVQVLLAFGADANLVNTRHHTPLDIATHLWLSHERRGKVSTGTNNLQTVQENPIIKSCPDVTSSPMPSPMPRRANLLARPGSTNSWVYVEEENGVSSPSQNETQEIERSTERSSEDSREFTSSVMPIKSADLAEEMSPLLGARFVHCDAAQQLKCIETIRSLLYSVHAHSGKAVLYRFTNKVPLLSSFSESDEFQKKLQARQALSPFWDSNEVENSVKIVDFEDGKTVFSLYEELEYNINLRLESEDYSPNADQAIAITFQQKEMRHFNKTMKHGIGFDVNGGSRLLFLDGGGIKGLVQLEVMRQLEEATGRRITELFDWIIGSSIGGILALGLVYANKSIKELQQICFKLKEEVFAKPRAGIAFNSRAMEKMIIDEFGLNMTMNDVRHPKVLVAAVNKRMSPPQLHFFNNCFKDRFSNTPVWKVARYTSAAPIFFTEFEDYVDGGVLANNPCDYGLTAIQNFHREMQMNLPISMVVSIGTGVYPPELLGKIDAQEFLFFGKHWFSFADNIKSRAQNLLSLLTNALVESEIVAKNCKTRCHEQNIPFYRFSPQLTNMVSAGETDSDKLVDMMLQTRIQSPQQGIAELASLFQLVANASKKNKYRRSRILAENNDL